MTYKYTIRGIDGSVLTFETTTNIDFHTLSNTAIAFEDMYINMANVIYIQKQIITKDSEEYITYDALDGMPMISKKHKGGEV